MLYAEGAFTDSETHVTTEDDFQKALDANPEDWHTRLVLADWLQERGDPRADGYRALGTRRKLAVRGSIEGMPGFEWGTNKTNMIVGTSPNHPEACLPHDWFALLALATPFGAWEPEIEYWKAYPSRRAAEDAAALAFALLPPARRAELLAVTVS